MKRFLKTTFEAFEILNVAPLKAIPVVLPMIQVFDAIFTLIIFA